jgi:dipeptidyl aminopeptidase/acylaminoacyl peptidase
VEQLRAASSVTVPQDFVSRPQAIEFPTDNGLTAHAFHYAPHNPQFTAPVGERPPLVVVCHGGPTAATYGRLNLEIQYWTSRGFAVVDVNYGGSSGSGRAYRERLKGQWGIVDVADCVNAARFLSATGAADADRLIMRGRSAGGYTTLATLTFRPDEFKAGASYYGIGDLERLMRDTHKFEARYLDGLIGPYPAMADVYRARSPIRWVERLSRPVIFFQGLDDHVVPPEQSRMMADAVRAKGLPVALLMFEGEQHGFRRADNISRCLEAELFFYGAMFGFRPAGVPPVFEIDNLSR